MHSLFGKTPPKTKDVNRKTVGILVTRNTEDWLVDSAKRFGVPLGAFVGLLVESARDNNQVLELATFGKYADEGRTGNRKLLVPGTESKSDESLSLLLQMADEYERGLDRPVADLSTQALVDVIIRLKNPGNFLDSDVDKAMSDLTDGYTLTESARNQIEDARECRYEILASWGDIAAKLILTIDQIKSQATNMKKPRSKRSLLRKAQEYERELTDFKAKIRASHRGSNIPKTVEEANRMIERREGQQNRPLLVIEGKQAS